MARSTGRGGLRDLERGRTMLCEERERERAMRGV